MAASRQEHGGQHPPEGTGADEDGEPEQAERGGHGWASGDDPGVDEALEPLDLRRVRIIHAQQVGPRLRLPDVLRSMLADETIVPGPRCEGYEPQPDPLAQAVLDAAEAYVDAHWPNGQQAMATHSRALANAVRAWREAQP